MKPLTFWNKIGYGAGALTENNVQNVVNIMLPLIMFNYMGVSPILLGYVFAIARLWDTVTDPLMGYLSDRTRSRFGRSGAAETPRESSIPQALLTDRLRKARL